jgi:hypothetical protein
MDMPGGFRLAERSQAKPLIGMYSESDCGKTKSALLLARGFVGPAGRIGMIETEAGRGEVYVGEPPIGDYMVRPIRGDFSPAEYGKAITEAEQAKLDALIIDSASHSWEGAGGVLSMAADAQARGMKGVLVWQKPKMEHQRHFMLRFMQTPIPLVILCMRAKYPMVERLNRKGEKEWTRSEVLEPKQADDILFEMMVHGWIDKEHRWHGTKYTVPALRDAIRDNEPVTIESGKRLAAWSSARASSAPSAATPAAPPAEAQQAPTPQAEGADGADLSSPVVEESGTAAADTSVRAGAGDGQGYDAKLQVKALWDGAERETTTANLRAYCDINRYQLDELRDKAPGEYAGLHAKLNQRMRDLKAKA